MESKLTKKAKPGVAIIVGALLVPASAFAAVSFAQPSNSEPDSVATATTADAWTAAADAALAATDEQVAVIADPVGASDDDLYRACTVDGPALVAAEFSGTITPLQSAALDALRQVCADEDMPLVGPPPEPPIVKTVTLQEGNLQQDPSVASDSQGSTGYYDDDDKYEHEDDEYEHEEEHEDDHHDDGGDDHYEDD